MFIDWNYGCVCFRFLLFHNATWYYLQVGGAAAVVALCCCALVALPLFLGLTLTLSRFLVRTCIVLSWFDISRMWAHTERWIVIVFPLRLLLCRSAVVYLFWTNWLSFCSHHRALSHLPAVCSLAVWVWMSAWMCARCNGSVLRTILVIRFFFSSLRLLLLIQQVRKIIQKSVEFFQFLVILIKTKQYSIVIWSFLCCAN